MKKLTIILALAALALFGGQALAQEKVLRVGSLGPFTGPAARVGQEFKDSINMVLEAVDYKVGDYKIEIFWIDSESDAEKSARAYEQTVVRDKIDVGFGGWHAWVSLSCMEVTAKYKIPHFFAFGAGSEINDKYNSDKEKYKYWVGKGWPTAYKLSIGYVDALEDAIAKGTWKPAEKKAAIFGVDNDWGRNFGNSLGQQLQDAGWEVVSYDWVQLGETDFIPLINKLKNANVALVGGTMSDPPSVSAFTKQTKEASLKSLVISDGLGWVGEWYELTGEYSDYILDMIPQWTSPKSQEFKKAFTDKYGYEPGPSTGGLCYDTATFFLKVLQTALEKYGELTTETITKCAEELVMTGQLSLTEGIMMKEYKYTPETFPDLVVGNDFYMFPVIQYMGGESIMIWPPHVKTKDLQIPPYAM
ncbi:MAG: ABC transporter substrate-binding protein [Deltaproteobacteria bacterium]|jgi:branched-chain amino acid transport system substrate-binding protein|nr:ABC transporter substrate-binding protein [Deltaproteobacteria bacterium]